MPEANALQPFELVLGPIIDAQQSLFVTVEAIEHGVLRDEERIPLRCDLGENELAMVQLRLCNRLLQRIEAPQQ